MLILLTYGIVLSMAGCALDRSGSCGEGEIICTVFKKEYSFTTDDNTYRFEGRCEIEDDGGGSTLGAPMFPFIVLGKYDRHTKEFKEVVKVTGEGGTEWAITGYCHTDPWLSPHAPVGVTNYSGNPQAFAQQLCLSEFPPEYWHVPFSRNVIIHMLSLQDLLSLVMQAANPETPTQPPAPPCPPAYLTGPPEMVMPKEGLVYKEDVKGVTVELKSKCGAENIDYSDSFYSVEFERHGDNGWQEFKYYKFPMQYSSSGGSIGMDTLALEGTGLWRVKARHVTTIKNSDAAIVGEYGNWVTFWIGQPKVELSKMDLSMFKNVQFFNQEYQKLDEAWKKKTIKPMPGSGAGKVKSGAMAQKSGTGKAEPGTAHPPEPGTVQSGAGAKTIPGSAQGGNAALTTQRDPLTMGGSRLKKSGPKLTVGDVNPTNTIKLVAGKTVDLAFPVSNSGDEVSDQTPYSISCKALGGGATCPFDDKRGTLSSIMANKRGEIRIEGLRFPAGDFELTLKLANVTSKLLKLNVAAAAVKPKAVKSTPSLQPSGGKDTNKQQQAPQLQLP